MSGTTKTRARAVADAAAAHLRATGNPSVGWGDARLLHEIAERLGWPAEGPATEKRVLAALQRGHGDVLIKGIESHPVRGAGRVRRFWLPESTPNQPF